MGLRVAGMLQNKGDLPSHPFVGAKVDPSRAAFPFAMSFARSGARASALAFSHAYRPRGSNGALLNKILGNFGGFRRHGFSSPVNDGSPCDYPLSGYQPSCLAPAH